MEMLSINKDVTTVYYPSPPLTDIKNLFQTNINEETER